MYVFTTGFCTKGGRIEPWQGIETLVLDKEFEKSRTAGIDIMKNSSVSSLELYSNH